MIHWRRECKTPQYTCQKEQCIKLEENNRRGKTRDLFRKTGDIKGTLHSKVDTIKNRNGIDLVDAEEIKKR